MHCRSQSGCFDGRNCNRLDADAVHLGILVHIENLGIALCTDGLEAVLGSN